MGNLPAAQALVEAVGDDLDVDAKTNAGVTPLMLAIASRNDEMVAFILEQSANPFFQDCLGKNAISYAQFMRDRNITNVMLVENLSLNPDL